MKNLTPFKESPVTERLLDFFSQKFPQSVIIIALLKCLAIISCKLMRPRFSLLHVAPSRHLKSYTLNEARKIFSSDFWISLGSDFTLNSLERYKKKLNENRCLLINDATTLLASKALRTKDRLIGGLSELLADESYKYQDFSRKFVLRGKITLNGNITSESFQNNKYRFLGLTFLERVLVAHSLLTNIENESWVSKQDKLATIHFNGKIRLNDIEPEIKEIPTAYYGEIQRQAREYSYLSLKGFIGCQDLIKGIVRAHAALNKRQEICDDDFKLLSMIKPCLTNPFSPYEGQIVKLRAQGFSYNKIQEAIGKKNYRRQIQRVVEKAQIRGILPID